MNRRPTAGSAGGTGPAAVVFDVDGTLVDSERDGHRVAFNLAFAEFGLRDHWDVASYGRLLRVTGGQRRLRAWFDEVGVATAEQDELVPLLHARKTELFMELVATGKVPARPGARRLLDELTAAGVTVAVATTGSRRWVEPLLDLLFGGADRFAAVVCGNDVTARKPEPEAYRVALRRLGTPAEATVAIEDSDNGVRSARGAGVAVVAVANGYTLGHELAGAAVVLDGFGTPDSPAHVLRDDHGIAAGGVIDLGVLSRVVAAPAP